MPKNKICDRFFVLIIVLTCIYNCVILIIVIFIQETELVKLKALIFSDSHYVTSGIDKAMSGNPDTKLIIFAGDMQKDAEYIMRAYPRIPCAYVLGNNDWSVHDVPYDRLFEFCGKKIFLTHGHNYGVKMSLLRLSMKAKSEGADICVFGHTHQSLLEHNDIWIVNPGSALFGYAVLTVEDGEINIELKKI